MNCSTKAKKLTAWFMLAAMALSVFSILSACRKTEQDMHVSAEIMRNPETPLVYPGESFVPTAEPTKKPSPTEMELAYSNPYECYMDQLKKLMHGESIGSDYETFVRVFSQQGEEHRFRLYLEDGEVSVRSISFGSSWQDEQVIFTFPNSNIWNDIFPPGMKLLDRLDMPKKWKWVLADGENTESPIYVPNYDQKSDAYWAVVFGGDWMVVTMSWGDPGCYYYNFSYNNVFGNETEWTHMPIAQSAHTMIFCTDDNWETWEKWDTAGVDRFAAHQLSDAVITENGVAYLCFKRFAMHYLDRGIGTPYSNSEVYITCDKGKTWEEVTRESAAELGLTETFVYVSTAYFEGLHGIVPIASFRVKYNDVTYRWDRCAESFDGGLTWRVRYFLKNDADGSYYLSDNIPEGYRWLFELEEN